MKIKKIIDLSKYEGELIVTDGLKDISGTCVSLPLHDNRIISIGYPIHHLCAFFLNDNPVIEILSNSKNQTYSLKKVGMIGMAYKVHGLVVNSNEYLIKVFGFTISLEYLYSPNYEGNRVANFKDGDWISFTVDRFDIVLSDT